MDNRKTNAEKRFTGLKDSISEVRRELIFGVVKGILYFISSSYILLHYVLTLKNVPKESIQITKELAYILAIISLVEFVHSFVNSLHGIKKLGALTFEKSECESELKLLTFEEIAKKERVVYMNIAKHKEFEE